MNSPSDETLDVHTSGSAQTSQWDTSLIDDTPDSADQPSPIIEDDGDQQQKPATAPMQKRRRVTRACDECRRKKIKCDGKQPCTHCTVYSYECTYDQPSNRRRNAAPQYIEALETQLKRAKALLFIISPTLDLNDPSIDAALQNGMLPQMHIAGPRPQQAPHGHPLSQPREELSRAESHDPQLESMVKATGQLDLDEEGNWDYHGHSSGLSFMRRVQQQFGDIMAPQGTSPFIKYRPMSQVFDSPSSAHQSPADSSSNMLAPGLDLPNKKEARMLCDNALIDAGALLRVVHIPSFYKSMDRIYETSPENYENAENQFLPLLYAVLALGTLFSKKADELDQIGYESAIDEGFKYFKASRQLLDIADCRDLTSLQAIVFMIQFLQSSAKLSTCYSYIGVALRSALRMGLHRSFNVNFTPIEAETRKRVFWVIRKMDTYVGAMLGLPIFLSDDDVDQDWPTEVDDEYITETEIRPMPEGKISLIAAANAHTQVIQILAKICKYVYPIKGTQSGGKHSVAYSVSYSKIREIEQDMQHWLDQLPMALKPGGEAPQVIVRVQQLLRMAFAHAQLLLYRPFLHYVTQSSKGKTDDQRAFACASACISVSRNIIHITAEMKRRGFLVGAYWFSMYTTFFAIISIIYFVLENPNSPTSYELLRDAQEGKENIFEKLPDNIKQGAEIVQSRKRRQESSPQSLQSRPTSLKQEADFIAMGPRRAATFPESMPNNKRTSLGHSLPISQQHYANLGIDPYSSPSGSVSDFFDPAPSLTPTSTTASSIGSFGPAAAHRPSLSFPASTFVDQTGLNVPLSDVSAMMFPSTDPFAYPHNNQPMTNFENSHNLQGFEPKGASPVVSSLPFVSGIDVKPHPATFSPVPIGPRPQPQPRGDNDVQLFGPMPMYLMQGAQLAGAQGPRAFPPQQHPHGMQMAGGEGGNMNFEDLFSGEEWANTFMDQGLGLSGGGTGFGGTPGGFGPGRPNMANWR
ncbi:fungal-specific transcription factor domain-containing protein [Lophiotrema nucula]|uniref:Fungal-specific transcription factor domain-containing protein n=1 Tax=Lophiotrema nucula TaxID=690887 RepID=A0A6A5Z854_9PLEO|nr:fungal-specific transcription factor domain-containing protein [Lophiotrema nucula]